jgi:hypothetical protein
MAAFVGPIRSRPARKHTTGITVEISTMARTTHAHAEPGSAAWDRVRLGKRASRTLADPLDPHGSGE